jgi:hypothetical protein
MCIHGTSTIVSLLFRKMLELYSNINFKSYYCPPVESNILVTTLLP